MEEVNVGVLVIDDKKQKPLAHPTNNEHLGNHRKTVINRRIFHSKNDRSWEERGSDPPLGI